MFNEYDDILTVDELCEVLKIGKNMAYILLGSGNIAASRIGRSWRIPKKSVEEYIVKTVYGIS